MQPHEERVVLEKRELDEKLGKLKAFCFDPGSPIFGALPPEDRDLLEDQYSHGKVFDYFRRTDRPFSKRKLMKVLLSAKTIEEVQAAADRCLHGDPVPNISENADDIFWLMGWADWQIEADMMREIEESK
jgi:hypothetical protein